MCSLVAVSFCPKDEATRRTDREEEWARVREGGELTGAVLLSSVREGVS